ncbi:unnamed protein product [Ectocarpus sp. CCAP 1310/34]|nr:unnamed protein product [Ectocarpus sp. CCAP 1310/34]
MPSYCPICAVSGAAAELAPACPLAADLGDEERMEFLTSHVAPGDVDARDEMVEFWSRVIAHAFEKAACLSLDSKVLVTSSLDWGGVVAPGLDLAMSHMVSSGELLERSEIVVFMWKVKGSFAVVTFFVLMLRPLRIGKNRNVLEDLAEQVVGYCQHLPPNESTVYLLAAGHSEASASCPVAQHASPWNFEQLCRTAAAAAEDAATATATRVASGRGPPTPEKCSVAAPRMLAHMSSDDVALFAKYLVRTKRAVTEGGLLKVLFRGGGNRVAAAGATVSETEKDLLRLRCTVASLEASASDLGLRIQRVQQDALMENRRGQKRAALVHLRRMKQYQAARDKRLSSLLTLETALDQVKQLRLDKQVLEAHEAATNALKACRETQGLTVERVEDTLDALAGEMAEAEAVGAALGQEGALLGQDEGETAELEAELDALLTAQDSPSPSPPPSSSSSQPPAVSKGPARAGERDTAASASAGPAAAMRRPSPNGTSDRASVPPRNNNPGSREDGVPLPA